MRVRTYDADLQDRPIEAGGVSVSAVRRLRVRHVGLRRAGGGAGVLSGSASPAYLLVWSRSGGPARRVAIADRTSIIAVGVKAAVAIAAQVARRRR